MKLYRLSFAKIYHLRDDLGEVIVDEGVSINLTMIDEIHSTFNDMFAGVFSLLINKSNAYSTELDALIKFGAHPGLDQIAVFAPNKLAKLSADFSADIPSSSTLNIQVFTCRDSALTWLNDVPS